MASKYVKPYIKRNKSEARDAEASSLVHHITTQCDVPVPRPSSHHNAPKTRQKNLSKSVFYGAEARALVVGIGKGEVE